MFTSFIALLILLLHIGCFTSSDRRHRQLLSNPKSSALFSFLKRIFSPSMHTAARPPPSVPSPSSSTRSIIRLAPTHDRASVIHTCHLCAEIFQTSTLLYHHQSTRHAIAELAEGENIVRIIFKMGWPEKAKTPTIHRILKIHNGPKTLARFEEYREWVKSRVGTAKGKNAADGNELLRFYCTTFTCELETSICGQHYCSTCGIIRSGFSQKMDGIGTMPTSWRANWVLEEEFSFMHVKRALLVCRVVAGRVRAPVDGEDPGSDSSVGGFEDELIVYNPRAVLPCFVIVYTL